MGAILNQITFPGNPHMSQNDEANLANHLFVHRCDRAWTVAMAEPSDIKEIKREKGKFETYGLVEAFGSMFRVFVVGMADQSLILTNWFWYLTRSWADSADCCSFSRWHHHCSVWYQIPLRGGGTVSKISSGNYNSNPIWCCQDEAASPNRSTEGNCCPSPSSTTETNPQLHQDSS